MPRKIEIEDTFRGNQAQKLEGKTYYWLTATKYLGRAFYRAQYQAVYEWHCDCGNYIMMYSKEVKEGRFKSCGCDKPAINKAIRGSNGKDTRHKMWNNFWEGHK